MEKYMIVCNKHQLELLANAVELQMRGRIGQGWAITENIIPFRSKDYRELKDVYDPILDVIVRRVASVDHYHPYELRPENANTRDIERDMWISLENALGKRDEELSLGEYGFMEIKKIKDD